MLDTLEMVVVIVPSICLNLNIMTMMGRRTKI